MCVSHTIDVNIFYKFLQKKKIPEIYNHITQQYLFNDIVFLLLIVCVTIYCPTPAQYLTVCGGLTTGSCRRLIISSTCLPNTIPNCSAIVLFKQLLSLCLGVQLTPILQTCDFQSFSLHQMGN